MFALVTFVKSNEVCIVPANWLKGNQCFWPITKDVQRLVKISQEPNTDWPQFEVTIKAVYVTYEGALQNERKYEDISNLEEDIEKSSRKRKGTERAEEIREESCMMKKKIYPDDRYHSSSVEKENENMLVEEVHGPPEQYYMVLAENSQAPLSNKQCCDCTEGINLIKEQMLHMKSVMKDQAQALYELSGVVNRIAENSNKPKLNSDSFPFQLPVSSKEELLKLEEALDEENVKYDLFEKMTQVGGIHLGNTLRRMLSRLMTNDVAVLYSWFGAKGKDPFRDLKVSKILFNAVRKNPALMTTSDCHIETVIKDWLRHAKARTVKRNV